MPYIFINPVCFQLLCFLRFQFLYTFFNGAVESRAAVVFNLYFHVKKSLWLPHLLIHISVDNADSEILAQIIQRVPLKTGPLSWFRLASGPVLSGTRSILPLRSFFLAVDITYKACNSTCYSLSFYKAHAPQVGRRYSDWATGWTTKQFTV
jgi:hypothetical protein